MHPYERPAIDEVVFRDAEGEIIDYGNRWDGSPPEETYSVDSHLERFAPVHIVADALIQHLHETYDVTIDEGVETATDLVRSPSQDVVRATRLRPNDPSCAPLTIVFTDYPSIHLHAGAVHDFLYPICGCDACDSNWQAEADELEQQVFAVVTGNYRESTTAGSRPATHYAFTYPDGSASGGLYAEQLPSDRLSTAKEILGNLRDGWSAWPLRP
jgi:hypothetical protein